MYDKIYHIKYDISLNERVDIMSRLSILANGTTALAPLHKSIFDMLKEGLYNYVITPDKISYKARLSQQFGISIIKNKEFDIIEKWEVAILKYSDKYDFNCAIVPEPRIKGMECDGTLHDLDDYQVAEVIGQIKTLTYDLDIENFFEGIDNFLQEVDDFVKGGDLND